MDRDSLVYKAKLAADEFQHGEHKRRHKINCYGLLMKLLAKEEHQQRYCSLPESLIHNGASRLLPRRNEREPQSMRDDGFGANGRWPTCAFCAGYARAGVGDGGPFLLFHGASIVVTALLHA